MAEQFVPGRELTVSVLDAGAPSAMCVTDIISNTGWYDYEAKYRRGGSRHVVPAEMPHEITALCIAHACTRTRAGLPWRVAHRFPLGRERAGSMGCSCWRPTPNRA